MIVFSCVDADYFNHVFLPSNTIFLSFIYSKHLDRNFLCMESRVLGLEPSPFFGSRYALSPSLENYRALPYKRQSSVDKLDRRCLSTKILYFGFPWLDSSTSLNKIKAFYSNCKRYYVVIANRSIPDNEEDEKVAITFDRYSDAATVLRDFTRTKLLSLLKGDFVCRGGWYPYVWVEYMDHPISLLGGTSSYTTRYELGPTWCHYLLCFLRDGFVGDVPFSSVFGFIQTDKFSRIVHYQEQL